MTHNTGPRLSGNHKVVRRTIILLSNVNTSVSAANVGQHIHMLLRFIKVLHPIADHQFPSRIPETHGECKSAGKTPSRQNTTPLECTDKSGDEENRDDTNHTPHPAPRTAAPSLRLQIRKGSQAATGGDGESKATWSDDSGHTAPKGTDWQPTGHDKFETHTIGKKRLTSDENYHRAYTKSGGRKSHCNKVDCQGNN